MQERKTYTREFKQRAASMVLDDSCSVPTSVHLWTLGLRLCAAGVVRSNRCVDTYADQWADQWVKTRGYQPPGNHCRASCTVTRKVCWLCSHASACSSGDAGLLHFGRVAKRCA